MTFLIKKLSLPKNITTFTVIKDKYHGADKTIITRENSCQNRIE